MARGRGFEVDYSLLFDEMDSNGMDVDQSAADTKKSTKENVRSAWKTFTNILKPGTRSGE